VTINRGRFVDRRSSWHWSEMRTVWASPLLAVTAQRPTEAPTRYHVHCTWLHHCWRSRLNALQRQRPGTMSTVRLMVISGPTKFVLVRPVSINEQAAQLSQRDRATRYVSW